MAFIKRHPIAVLFVLAYTLTWGATLSGLKAPARNANPTATPSHS